MDYFNALKILIELTFVVFEESFNVSRYVWIEFQPSWHPFVQAAPPQRVDESNVP